MTGKEKTDFKFFSSFLSLELFPTDTRKKEILGKYILEYTRYCTQGRNEFIFLPWQLVIMSCFCRLHSDGFGLLCELRARPVCFNRGFLFSERAIGAGYYFN